MTNWLIRLLFGAAIIAAIIGIAYLIFTGGEKEPAAPLPNGTEQPTEEVLLYYYNPTKDRDASGNILCSRQGIEAVERTVPKGPNTLEETLELLLRGELTNAERGRGITTEFPLEGFSLRDTELAKGVLTLSFNDPEHTASGGSCRVQILRLSLEATVQQFPGIEEVRFEPPEILQP